MFEMSSVPGLSRDLEWKAPRLPEPVGRAGLRLVAEKQGSVLREGDQAAENPVCLLTALSLGEVILSGGRVSRSVSS